MSEREELAEVITAAFSDAQDVGGGIAADAVLASPWLRAHDDRTRSDTLAPVLALADEWERSLPAIRTDQAHARLDCLRALRTVVRDTLDHAAALRVAAGTPTHHTTEEETQ